MKKIIALVLVLGGCVTETGSAETVYEGTIVIALAIATTGTASLLESADETAIAIDGCVIPIEFVEPGVFRQDGLSVQCDYGIAARIEGSVEGETMRLVMTYDDGRLLTFDGNEVGR